MWITDHIQWTFHICVIWCQMTNMTSKIWHKSFGSSLCLKKCWDHSFITCWTVLGCIKMKWLKSASKTFVLFKYWKSLFFLYSGCKLIRQYRKLENWENKTFYWLEWHKYFWTERFDDFLAKWETLNNL